MKNSFVSVGKILNFHGVHGEAKLGYSKNREEFLSRLKEVYVQINNEYKKLEIARIRFTPKCGIIKFKGINTLNEILPYKNKHCRLKNRHNLFRPLSVAFLWLAQQCRSLFGAGY